MNKQELKVELDMNAEAWALRRDMLRSIKSELFSAMTLAGPLEIIDGRVKCNGDRRWELEARLARWNTKPLKSGKTLAVEVLQFIRAEDRVEIMVTEFMPTTRSASYNE